MTNYIETLGAILLTVIVVALICGISGGVWMLLSAIRHRNG